MRQRVVLSLLSSPNLVWSSARQQTVTPVPQLASSSCCPAQLHNARKVIGGGEAIAGQESDGLLPPPPWVRLQGLALTLSWSPAFLASCAFTASWCRLSHEARTDASQQFVCINARQRILSWALHSMPASTPCFSSCRPVSAAGRASWSRGCSRLTHMPTNKVTLQTPTQNKINVPQRQPRTK